LQNPLHVSYLPIMNPLGAQTVSEGKPATLAPILSDRDGDALECTASNLPPWMRFEAATCSAGGTPGFELTSQAAPKKPYPDIRLQACDPEHVCIRATTTITVVNANRKPVLDRLGDRAVDERKTLAFEARASDPDQEAVTLAASPLPDGAAFTDGGNGRATFTWAPREDQAGSYAVTVAATDGSLEDAETVRLQVRETTLTISGKILTDTGSRLAGATIELSRAGEHAHQVATDARGLYRASNLPPGKYIIRPSARASNLPTFKVIHFSPLSRQVDLADRDQRDLDFTAHFKSLRHVFG
jgi:hypothetical protein